MHSINRPSNGRMRVLVYRLRVTTSGAVLALALQAAYDLRTKFGPLATRPGTIILRAFGDYNPL